MRKLFTLLALFVAIAMYAQSERLDYYQHIKTVRANGAVETRSGNEGQFIKRTKQYGNARCYDATSTGLDHLNGCLSFIGYKDSREVYKGFCYWGEGTIYQFDDSKGYLNVTDAKGNVYVFRRTTPPPGRKCSSYLSKGANKDGWDGVAEWNKIHSGYNNDNSGNSGSSSGRSKANSRKSGSSNTCGYCHGSKRVRAHVGVSGYGVTSSKKKCPTCGVVYDTSCDHWHACPYCK